MGPASPFAVHQLAHLGAEVIKVEVREGGDLARQLGADPALNDALTTRTKARLVIERRRKLLILGQTATGHTQATGSPMTGPAQTTGTSTTGTSTTAGVSRLLPLPEDLGDCLTYARALNEAPLRRRLSWN